LYKESKRKKGNPIKEDATVCLNTPSAETFPQTQPVFFIAAESQYPTQLA
jgi:hypothetical protein